MKELYLKIKRYMIKKYSSSEQSNAPNYYSCHSDSIYYSKLWPIIFLFSALTDIPMPLPKGKKPGQHRDWGFLPILIVTGIFVFVYYGYTVHIVCKFQSFI